MAILTDTEKAELRQELARGAATVDYDKPTVNAALQAIEDWFEANRAAIASAINTATTPFVFTGGQKKRLVAFWLRQKFRREGG